MHRLIDPPRHGHFVSRNDQKDLRIGDFIAFWDGHKRFEEFLRHQRFALVGVPDDRGVENSKGREGASHAPETIRKIFYTFTPGCLTPIKADICDLGNIRLAHTIEETHERLAKIVEMLLMHHVIPIVLGGGQDNTYGTIKGCIRDKVGAVNIDCHLDLRPSDISINSGTAFYRLLEHRLLEGKRLVIFGFQEHRNSPHHYHYGKTKGVHMWEHSLVMNGIEKYFKKALDKAGKNSAVSFDMDSIRMGEAPGVSAPNPSGFSAKEMELMASIAGKDKRVRAIDIMETNPTQDYDNQTSRLAASMIWHFISGRNTL